MNEMLDIKEVCERYGLSQVYVRRMILKGTIPTTKVEIGKNTFKHVMNVTDIEKWREASQNRSKRQDGRGRYILHATLEEIDQLQQLLDENDLNVLITRQNKVKNTLESES